MKGKIVLVPFPFTDLSTSKLRPALVLVEGETDSVVAFISSRIPAQPATTEVLIPQDHREFGLTGLKTASIVRLDKLQQFPGVLSSERLEKSENHSAKRLTEYYVKCTRSDGGFSIT